MLRLLIVDDEPFAVDYLADALRGLSDLDLDIVLAYSGKEAISAMDEGKVDLLLSDIRMPGMGGIELAEHALMRWPRCKVIFLTGYSDFEAIQSALRKGGVDYVLKTEGDEAIVRAIRQAIVAIETQEREEQILQRARQQYKLALPSLRRNYLMDVLLGESNNPETREQAFRKLAIGLDPDRPVFAALVRIDEWGTFSAPADRALLLYSIQNVAEETIGERLSFLSFQYDRARIVWLVQEELGQSGEEAFRSFSDCAQHVQLSCKTLLKAPISIVISARRTDWERLGGRIEAVKLLLAFQMGPGNGMMIFDPDSEGTESRRSSRSLLETERLRRMTHKLDLLESYLDDGKTAEFASLFDELFAMERPLALVGEEKWFGLELFSRLSAFFLSYLNTREMFEEVGERIRTEKMTSPDEHSGMLEMLAYFRDLGITIAAYNERNHIERSHEMIRKVQNYIRQFLHEELSLTRLSGLVFLSPPYFSRMYKQMTGQGLLEYINETRIQKAKVLLKTTNRKVHEIAVDVGLESAPYFTRLFRKKAGCTPQEYRDSGRGSD
ncbi:response regulator transcription factor [Cohnella fermenti]|uniref:Response regulator n=1 Tax=Cohnella fermenti TaxID=2565925 RepID=A0A4S4BP41_9BACL|nr:response regulator [Cohnella fermenti]THF76669.1 response regulator [Cohnella fermenti]